jgi:hypothetical protein
MPKRSLTTEAAEWRMPNTLLEVDATDCLHSCAHCLWVLRQRIQSQ